MYFDADRQVYIDTETGDIIPIEVDDDVPHKPSSPGGRAGNINNGFDQGYNRVNNQSVFGQVHYDNSERFYSNEGEVIGSHEVALYDSQGVGWDGKQQNHQDDWAFARYIQALEFESYNSAFVYGANQAQEDPTNADFNNKEVNASNWKKQCLTISTLICVVQIVILIAMIQTGGYAPKKYNPMIGPPPETMVEFGAKVKYLIVVKNEWWRLITPIFLHAGIIHLLSNVLIQLRVGGYLNRIFGNFNFLMIYFLSGIYGNILSCAFLPQSIAVGSSGAVLGMLSSWLVWIVFRWNKVPQIYHSQRNCQLGVVFASIALTLGMSFGQYIDWAAHFGGSIMGILLAVVLLSQELEWMYMKHLRIAALCVIVAAFAAGLFSIFYGPSQNVVVKS